MLTDPPPGAKSSFGFPASPPDQMVSINPTDAIVANLSDMEVNYGSA